MPLRIPRFPVICSDTIIVISHRRNRNCYTKRKALSTLRGRGINIRRRFVMTQAGGLPGPFQSWGRTSISFSPHHRSSIGCNRAARGEFINVAMARSRMVFFIGYFTLDYRQDLISHFGVPFDSSALKVTDGKRRFS